MKFFLVSKSFEGDQPVLGFGVYGKNKKKYIFVRKTFMQDTVAQVRLNRLASVTDLHVLKTAEMEGSKKKFFDLVGSIFQKDTMVLLNPIDANNFLRGIENLAQVSPENPKSESEVLSEALSEANADDSEKPDTDPDYLGEHGHVHPEIHEHHPNCPHHPDNQEVVKAVQDSIESNQESDPATIYELRSVALTSIQDIFRYDVSGIEFLTPPDATDASEAEVKFIDGRRFKLTIEEIHGDGQESR